MILAVMQRDPVLLDCIERAIAATETRLVRVQQIENAAVALARIAGGGVHGIVFDISNPVIANRGPMEACERFFRESGGIPLAILCDVGDEALAIRAVSNGATSYAVKERVDDVTTAVSKVIRQRPQEPAAVRTRPWNSSQKQIVCMGAKGGVGATLMALNLAAVLAETRSVILTEMHTELGSLGSYFGVVGPQRSMIDLNQEPVTLAAVRTSLWRCPEIPGLQILFGSQGIGSAAMKPEVATQICAILPQLSECVLIDLPHSLSAVNRSVMETSDLITLVVTREPLCLALSAEFTRRLRSWNSLPEIGLVVVNQTALASPVSIAQFEAELGVQCFGAIPPVSDLCVHAQMQRVPPLVLDHEGLLRDSVLAIAGRMFPAPTPNRAVPVAVHTLGRKRY